MIAFSNGKKFEYLGPSSWSFHRRLKGHGLNDIIGIGSKENYVTVFDLGGKSIKDQP